MSKLVKVSRAEEDGGHQLVVEEFLEEVLERAMSAWPEEGRALKIYFPRC